MGTANPRILFFGNNWVGWQVVDWLRTQGGQIVGLVLHPPERRRYAAEIIQAAGIKQAQIFDGAQLQEPAVLEAIKTLRPDLGVSALFGYILRRELLDLMPNGCINVHPAMLPYNRGAYPNVWSIVEDTPAGVTIHFMDEGVDTGDIIAQRQVPVEPVDTGASLYHKLEQTCIELFQETWPLIRSSQAPRIPQPQGGTFHRTRDVARIDEIDLDRTYTARELINILRARTFAPYPGAYFRDGQRRVYVQLRLCYGDQPEQEHS